MTVSISVEAPAIHKLSTSCVCTCVDQVVSGRWRILNPRTPTSPWLPNTRASCGWRSDMVWHHRVSCEVSSRESDHRLVVATDAPCAASRGHSLQVFRWYRCFHSVSTPFWITCVLHACKRFSERLYRSAFLIFHTGETSLCCLSQLMLRGVLILIVFNIQTMVYTDSSPKPAEHCSG